MFQKIRSALRKLWMFWPSKKIVLNNNRVVVTGKRHRFEYSCELCGEEGLTQKQVQVDHIVPAGSLKSFEDLGGFAERLFCEPEGLQVVCKPCHKVKTAEERKRR